MNAVSDKLLKNIKDDFSVMSKVVLKQLKLIKEIVEGHDEDLIEDVRCNEHILDSMEVKIRSEIINSIVLYAPRATNLRKIIAYYDMTAFLERCGDLFKNVAGFLRKMDLDGEIAKEVRPQLNDMLEVVQTMLQNAIFAFTCKDPQLARDTIEMDDKMDELYHQTIRILEKRACGVELTQQQVIDVLSMSSLSYNLERICDNATNIAESALYLIEGVDVKHAPAPEVSSTNMKDE